MSGELTAEHGDAPTAVDGDTPSAQATHNPLPWRFEELRNGVGVVYDALGELVLFCPESCSAQDVANLELIVAKVNAGLPDVVAWEGGGHS